MKESIINYFNKLGQHKITFNPAIKIKALQTNQPAWIDNMYQVSSAYMVSISTRMDDAKRNINNLSTEELTSLNNRLWSMVQDLEKKPVSAMIVKRDPKVKAMIVEKIR